MHSIPPPKTPRHQCISRSLWPSMHGPKWLRDFLGSLRTLKRDVASLVHQSAKLQCLSSLFLGNDLFCRCRVGWKVERRVLLPYHLDYHEKSWNVWFMISSASTGKRIQHCSFISGSESRQFTKKDPKNDSFTGPNAMNDSKKNLLWLWQIPPWAALFGYAISSEVACLIRTRSSNVDFLTRCENDGFGVKLRRVEMLAGFAPWRMLH